MPGHRIGFADYLSRHPTVEAPCNSKFDNNYVVNWTRAFARQLSQYKNRISRNSKTLATHKSAANKQTESSLIKRNASSSNKQNAISAELGIDKSNYHANPTDVGTRQSSKQLTLSHPNTRSNTLP